LERRTIVGAEAETLDLVLGAGEAGEDQNRCLHLGDTQRPQHFEARHVGQVQVEQDDVVVVQLAEIDTFLAKIRGVDVEALGFEHQLDRLRGGAIILDQQYAHASPLPRRFRAKGSAGRNGGPMKTLWEKPIRTLASHG
jgi:hypothetical protein